MPTNSKKFIISVRVFQIYIIKNALPSEFLRFSQTFFCCKRKGTDFLCKINIINFIFDNKKNVIFVEKYQTGRFVV